MGNYMVRQYINKNVYEAFLDRMQFIFQEFENIFTRIKKSVSFIRISRHSIL